MFLRRSVHRRKTATSQPAHIHHKRSAQKQPKMLDNSAVGKAPTVALVRKMMVNISVSSIREWDCDFIWLTKHSLVTRTENSSLLVSRQKIMDNKVRRRKDEHDALTKFTNLTYLIHTITGDSSKVGTGQTRGMKWWVCPSTFVLSLVLCPHYNAATNTICYPMLLIGRRSTPCTMNNQSSTGPYYHKSASCKAWHGDEQDGRACWYGGAQGSTRGNPGIRWWRCQLWEGGTGIAKYVK